jgi:hypothetical protein
MHFPLQSFRFNAFTVHIFRFVHFTLQMLPFNAFPVQIIRYNAFSGANFPVSTAARNFVVSLHFAWLYSDLGWCDFVRRSRVVVCSEVGRGDKLDWGRRR